MKSLVFWLKFHWKCPYEFNWEYPYIGLDNGLAPNRWQAIIWTNTDLIHWHIYAALAGDELIKYKLNCVKRIINLYLNMTFSQKDMW